MVRDVKIIAHLETSDQALLDSWREFMNHFSEHSAPKNQQFQIKLF